MYDYMYQYRCEIERIISNTRYHRGQAITHIREIYNRGLIDIVEWNTLREYCDTYRKSYEKFGV